MKNQNNKTLFVISVVTRFLFIGLLLTIIFLGLVESKEQDSIIVSQQELGVNLSQFIDETTENLYTKENAALDFVIRDGQIEQIKINVAAIKTLADKNKQRIETLEQTQKELVGTKTDQ